MLAVKLVGATWGRYTHPPSSPTQCNTSAAMTEQLVTEAAVETVAAAEQPVATGAAAGGAVGEAAAAAAAEQAGEVSIRQMRPGAEENRIVRDVWISGYRSYSENPCNDPPSTEGGAGGWGLGLAAARASVGLRVRAAQ
jgi:hypothetical protein